MKNYRNCLIDEKICDLLIIYLRFNDYSCSSKAENYHPKNTRYIFLNWKTQNISIRS